MSKRERRRGNAARAAPALLIPKRGTLERVFLDKLMTGAHVTFADFVGTGITEHNIDQIAKNLQSGMFEAENDNIIRMDS